MGCSTAYDPAGKSSRASDRNTKPTHEDNKGKPIGMMPTRTSNRIAAHNQLCAENALSSDAASNPPQPTRNRNRRNGCQAVESPGAHNKQLRAVPVLTGLWGPLPQELVDIILGYCTCKQLAMLETSSAFFRRTNIIENLAEMRLKAIARAKGMLPNPQAHEKYTSLLHFVQSQSAAAAQATAIAFGGSHAAAVLVPSQDAKTGHNSSYTFGRGFYGQLGHGDYEAQPQPKLLCIGYQPSTEHPGYEDEVTAAVVAAGSAYTASITRRGQLMTFGLGSCGELGHELPSAGEVPYLMRSILSTRTTVRIVSVACGASHTLAISELGCVWSCGRNQDSQLGNSSFGDGMQLRPVTGIRGPRIVSCAAGASHSMALGSDGTLWTWGSGAYGQLGHSSLQAVWLMAPEQAIVLSAPQKIAALEPIHLKPWERVTSIAAGGHHSCAVTVEGSLLMFGRNSHGQLGMGDHESRWRPTAGSISAGKHSNKYRTIQVACGLQHTLALIAHCGRVKPFATGMNSFGQLGHGNHAELRSFKTIKPLLSMNVVALQAGDHSSAAICEDGNLYMWGRNDNYQLGLGDYIFRLRPTCLAGYKAVHPDKTLRRRKRTATRMRPITDPPIKPDVTPCNNQLAVLFASQAAEKKGLKMSTPLPADPAATQPSDLAATTGTHAKRVT